MSIVEQSPSHQRLAEAARDRGYWKSIWEAYIQQQKPYGLYNEDYLFFNQHSENYNDLSTALYTTFKHFIGKQVRSNYHRIGDTK